MLCEHDKGTVALTTVRSKFVKMSLASLRKLLDSYIKLPLPRHYNFPSTSLFLIVVGLILGKIKISIFCDLAIFDRHSVSGRGTGSKSCKRCIYLQRRGNISYMALIGIYTRSKGSSILINWRGEGGANNERKYGKRIVFMHIIVYL